MEKWEYVTLAYKTWGDDETNANLTAWGEQGWEVGSIAVDNSLRPYWTVFVLLKRRVS